MRSGIVEAKFLLASVGCVERAGVDGIFVVWEKDERCERYVFREYLRSGEYVLVGNVGESGSVACYRSVQHANRKPENRVVDGLRSSIINPGIGLRRQ